MTTESNEPRLWGKTDEDIMDELSMIEYWFGCDRVVKDGNEVISRENQTNPYSPIERTMGLFASALLRIMKSQMGYETYKPSKLKSSAISQRRK